MGSLINQSIDCLINNGYMDGLVNWWGLKTFSFETSDKVFRQKICGFNRNFHNDEHKLFIHFACFAVKTDRSLQIMLYYKFSMRSLLGIFIAADNNACHNGFYFTMFSVGLAYIHKTDQPSCI